MNTFSNDHAHYTCSGSKKSGQILKIAKIDLAESNCVPSIKYPEIFFSPHDLPGGRA